MGFGSIEVFVKSYPLEESDNKTDRCSIVRFPYMKIEDYEKFHLMPYAALCIIDNSELNALLRACEDAKHTEWNPNGIEDNEKREKAKSAYRSLKTNITKAIKEVLKTEIADRVDMRGAGVYLPSVEHLDTSNMGEQNVSDFEADVGESVHLGRRRINSVVRDRGYSTKYGNEKHIDGLVGEEGDDGEELGYNTTNSIYGHGNGHNGKTNRQKDYHPYNAASGITQEGKTKTELGGMRIRNIYNQRLGRYEVLFLSRYDVIDCDLEINQVDEEGNIIKEETLQILEAYVNGIKATVIGNKITGVSLQKDTKYVVSYCISSKERFGAKVVIYENR